MESADRPAILFDQNFLIPAIDLIGGKCVRLTKGDYAQQTTYSDDPVAMARQFEAAGVRRLHLVDLDGARSGAMQHLSVLEKIASATSLVIDFGGGVKTIEDVQKILDAGASMVTIGSLAVRDPGLLEEWLMEFGATKFFIGADVLNDHIKISGWQEDSGIDVYDFIGRMLSLGSANIFCTDISKDGMMKGPSVELYKNILKEHPEVKLTASGGISTFDDLVELKNTGCAGAIVGKALYEGNISLEEIYKFNS